MTRVEIKQKIEKKNLKKTNKCENVFKKINKIVKTLATVTTQKFANCKLGSASPQILQK